jgi:O-succinylbenzoate synthase
MDVELRRIRLPFAAPFRTALGIQQDRDVLLVAVRTDVGEGWGECVAMNAPIYTAEYVSGAHSVIRDVLLPLLSKSDVTAVTLGRALTSIQGHRMAKAALEMALLDAELRSSDTSLATYLGAAASRVAVGVALGIDRDVARLLDTVRRYIDRGYRRVKLKIMPGWDIEPVAAVRQTFGNDLTLQVDGNRAYGPAEMARLSALDAFDLAMIEQPFGDLVTHATFARTIRTPICLDESITSTEATRLALTLGACSIVNIKPGRVGGYLEARRIHDLCVARGVPVWCGGMFETGLGRAANLALAALPGFTLPSDISESSRYFERDITDPFMLEPDGTIGVPDGPGIGVSPDPERLVEVTTSVEHFRI